MSILVLTATLPWAWLSQSSIHCHQGHLGTQTKDNDVIYWPLIVYPSHMLEGVSSQICPSLASSDQIMKLSVVMYHHIKSN